MTWSIKIHRYVTGIDQIWEVWRWNTKDVKKIGLTWIELVSQESNSSKGKLSRQK